MSESCSCSCGGNCKPLLYACSGAANTGYLADAVARSLMKNGTGSMTCLAAVGAGLSGFTETAKNAKNIVIDGCPTACGKKIFEAQNLDFTHLVLTDFDVQKGKTEITPELIEKTAIKVENKI
ncbi:MAG: putative zinc-binding protein [Spirochaetes bacterium]|nr:putative zinc-binding protein [Spirochaetota bacterium]MBN2770432.1 putative zinc-binding protein [Spirochaetota bacterium]